MQPAGLHAWTSPDVGNATLVPAGRNRCCRFDIRGRQTILDVGNAALIPPRSNRCCRFDIRDARPSQNTRCCCFRLQNRSKMAATNCFMGDSHARAAEQQPSARTGWQQVRTEPVAFGCLRLSVFLDQLATGPHRVRGHGASRWCRICGLRPFEVQSCSLNA